MDISDDVITSSSMNAEDVVEAVWASYATKAALGVLDLNVRITRNAPLFHRPLKLQCCLQHLQRHSLLQA
jgi:hypothetical protein